MKKGYHKLLDQIIEYAEVEGGKERRESLKVHQGEQAIGDGWMVHHLKLLKELSEE